MTEKPKAVRLLSGQAPPRGDFFPEGKTPADGDMLLMEAIRRDLEETRRFNERFDEKTPDGTGSFYFFNLFI